MRVTHMTPTNPTDAQMKLADVTQADREAAQREASAIYLANSDVLCDRDLEIMETVLVQAFARHRLATEARAQGLVDALEAAQNLLSNSGAESGYCCCGDPVSSHSIGSGHAPVDSHGYYAEKCCQNIDQALATWRRT